MQDPAVATDCSLLSQRHRVCMCTSAGGDTVTHELTSSAVVSGGGASFTFARGLSPTSPHTAEEVISAADGMSSHGWCCPPPPTHTHAGQALSTLSVGELSCTHVLSVSTHRHHHSPLWLISIMCHCAPSNNSRHHSVTRVHVHISSWGHCQDMDSPPLQWWQEVEFPTTLTRGLRPTSPHTAEEVISTADGMSLHG